MRSSLLFLCVLTCTPPIAAQDPFEIHIYEQDPFEIHIYEYEPMPLGRYSLEAHLNGMAQGTAVRDGTLLPTLHQAHLTIEPTVGLSESFVIGFMFLNAWEPGYSPQFAGWRVLPHVYAPESWGLPARLGFVAEFSFQNRRYEENTRRIELRPILDREFGRWQIVLNPVVERACTGLELRMAGTLSLGCCSVGNESASRRRSSITEKLRASTYSRGLSRRFTSCSAAETGPQHSDSKSISAWVLTWGAAALEWS